MNKVAFVTGADRGLGFALSAGLLERNWTVCAGQYMPEWFGLEELAARHPGRLHVVPLDVASEISVQEASRVIGKVINHVDVLINNAGVTSPTMRAIIREPQNYREMHRLFDVNALGPLRVVEALLPMLDAGVMKRLCFVSSEAGSIQRCQRESWFGYTMSKAALNMAVKTLFNHLRPEGFTFRLYHPGWMRTYMGGSKNNQADMEPEEAAEYALDYFLNDLRNDLQHPEQNPEDMLVLRDWQGEVWPW